MHIQPGFETCFKARLRVRTPSPRVPQPLVRQDKGRRDRGICGNLRPWPVEMAQVRQTPVDRCDTLGVCACGGSLSHTRFLLCQ